jgi:TRAP-type C4-dicarboxylate transport system substrate-binding protein
MFVYRANLPRTLMLVAALFSAAAATGAFACEFRAADVQAESYPTVQAPRFIGRTVAERSADSHQIRTFHARRFVDEEETIEQRRAAAINLDCTNMTPIGTFVPSISFDPNGLAFHDSGARSVAALIERIRRVE